MEKGEQLFQQLMDANIPTILEGVKGGGGRWPMPIFESSFFVAYYDSSLIAENLLKITDELLAQGKNICDIAKLYKYPSRLARFANMFPGRSLWSMNFKKQKTLAFRIALILDCLYKRNAFNQGNKNIIYSEKEIKTLTENTQYFTGNSISQVKKLSSLLWLVAESYSPKFTNIFYEFSGEYKLDNKYFIVKDYHNLNPEYLTFEVPYSFSDIKIIDIHNIHIDYKVDIMCRSLASNQNIPNPEAVLLIVDGNVITDSDVVTDMIKKLLSALQQATNHLNSLSRDQIIVWNATIDLYAFLYPLIGKDCFKLLSKNFLNEINTKEFKNKYNKAVNWFNSIPKDVEGWTTILDPRKFIEI